MLLVERTYFVVILSKYFVEKGVIGEFIMQVNCTDDENNRNQCCYCSGQWT